MHDPRKKVRDILIPGSHNALSYTMENIPILKNAARCQNLSITCQLNLGVRVVDIRLGNCGPSKNDFKVVHGMATGARVEPKLNEIFTFLEKHPTEFVYLEVTSEHSRNLKPHQLEHALNLIDQILGSYMIKGSDPNHKKYFPQEATIELLNHPEKRIMVLVCSDFCNYTINSSYYGVNE